MAASSARSPLVPDGGGCGGDEDQDPCGYVAGQSVAGGHGLYPVAAPLADVVSLDNREDIRNLTLHAAPGAASRHAQAGGYLQLPLSAEGTGRTWSEAFGGRRRITTMLTALAGIGMLGVSIGVLLHTLPDRGSRRAVSGSARLESSSQASRAAQLVAVHGGDDEDPPPDAERAGARAAARQRGAAPPAEHAEASIDALPQCDMACQETRRSRKRLQSYWDIGSCGDLEDDLNVHWCGGRIEEPHCLPEVDVHPAVCTSMRARLTHVNASTRKWLFWKDYVVIDDCSYEYIAQYECMATTTTTTVTTTTSTTSVTTSTTSSSTTTSTLETEEMFRARLKARFPEPEDFSCEEACPWCYKTIEPPEPKQWANSLNGVKLRDVCFGKQGLHRIFVIGDWGGVIKDDGRVAPADMRDPKRFPDRTRDFVWGVDDQAQQRVAWAMQQRAEVSRPDYVINVGDNFYWGGIDDTCGRSVQDRKWNEQFQKIFEDIYKGHGIDGIPWLGVLGNHDYGGYRFDAAWDQAIAYTWSSPRWRTPAQYWKIKIHYPGFSVDYFFADTNADDSAPISGDPHHNMCNKIHNKWTSGCGPQGPKSLTDCPGWFQRLWNDQATWLEASLNASTATWQVVVTHFPPVHNVEYWKDLSYRYGIDLILAGHAHNQEVHYTEPGNPFYPTAWIVSGGGGGITSEGTPTPDGLDVQYGFFELTLTPGEIEMRGISHGGKIMQRIFLIPRERATGYVGRT